MLKMQTDGDDGNEDGGGDQSPINVENLTHLLWFEGLVHDQLDLVLGRVECIDGTH